MALADSSENAILDLSKKVTKEEIYSRPDMSTNVNYLTSLGQVKSCSPEHLKIIKKLHSIEITDIEKSRQNKYIEGKSPTSPDSQLFNVQRHNISASLSNTSDVYPLVENIFTGPALAQNQQELCSKWVKTLPHRKRPITLIKSNCDDFAIKRLKTSFQDEVCSFVPLQNDDQESLASSKSPELFSPSNTPDKCDFVMNNCDQTPGEALLPSPSDSSLTKSSFRGRGGQLKDEAYWERRRKNNEAAKRSRDTRKQKEEETAHKARSLAQENISLKAEINILRTQLCNMQSMLFYRTNTRSLI